LELTAIQVQTIATKAYHKDQLLRLSVKLF